MFQGAFLRGKIQSHFEKLTHYEIKESPAKIFIVRCFSFILVS